MRSGDFPCASGIVFSEEVVVAEICKFANIISDLTLEDVQLAFERQLSRSFPSASDPVFVSDEDGLQKSVSFCSFAVDLEAGNEEFFRILEMSRLGRRFDFLVSEELREFGNMGPNTL